MAKVCDICGNPIGFMEGDSKSISINGNTLSISRCRNCSDCFFFIETFLDGNTKTISNIDTYEKEKKKIKQHIDEGKCSKEGKAYSEYIIQKFDNTVQRRAYEYEINVELEKQGEQRKEQEQKLLLQRARDFKVTTGYNFEGYKITKYLGIVTNEALVGTGIISELSSQFNDGMGTESSINKSKLSKSKQIALKRLMEDALIIGANAIIGIDYDIMTFSNNTIVTSINGTAVYIEEEIMK